MLVEFVLLVRLTCWSVKTVIWHVGGGQQCVCV
jgi:hypothetical protein